jgi:signal transduction histidine kinase
LQVSRAQRLDDEGRNLLSRMEADSQRLQRLIDAMLNLARAADGELRRQPLDLGALAASILRDLREQEPGRQVEERIAPGLTADADPDLVRLALTNLLANAWKFTRNRTVAHIEVGVDRDGPGGPAFFVRDDGAGFDPQYAGKLFQAFQRLHGPAEFEGTGVGLTTVMRIVTRHGGRVWATGARDQGASFHFTLPPGPPRS